MAAARRISHDQLLKEALTAFLPDFVTLFAPDQAALLDFSHIRFLDKELLPPETAARWMCWPRCAHARAVPRG